VASGTVDEHRKPILVLNYKGFYEGLKLQAQHMRDLKFLPEVEHFAPQFVDTMDELVERIKNIELKIKIKN
jgi:predicted Rossmann-fold nucleotide-binding protein